MPERVSSIVFASLEPTKLGQQNSELPLHVTVVPPFEHAINQTNNVFEVFGDQLAQVEPFTIVGGELDNFGTDEVPLIVRKIVGNQALTAVHLSLFKGFSNLPEVAVDSTFAGSADKYNPHSTFKGSASLAEGEERLITSLYLGQKRKYINAAGLYKSWHIIGQMNLDGQV